MSRARVNNYLKRLAVIIFLAIVVFIILILVTKMFFGTNDDNNKLGEDLLNRNTSIYQSTTLGNDEILKINDFLNNLINACNEKKYQDVYNMFSESYKKRFNLTLEDVIEFCNKEFDKYKLYNYQNLSVINNRVIYELKIYDDIMATGVNSFDDYDYNVITIVITKALDGTYKISLNGYIETVEYNQESNYGNYIIYVLSKDVYYEYETYMVRIKNESDNECLCIAKDYELSNIKLKTKYEKADNSLDCKTTLNPFISNLLVYPSSQRDIELKFNKYYDIVNMDISNALVFDNIAHIPYEILDNISDIYELQNVLLENPNSIEIKLNK